jgi:hypothetical protein
LFQKTSEDGEKIMGGGINTAHCLTTPQAAGAPSFYTIKLSTARKILCNLYS